MREPVARPVLLGLLVIFLGCAGWWWTHPTLLADTSPLGSGAFASKPLDQATSHMAVAMGPRSDETIRLRSVGARFAVNSAQARASFSICEHRPGAIPIGAVGNEEPLSTYCSQVRPLTDGTELRFSANDRGEPEEYILMTITPTAPGRARVDQISFDYARGWQRLGQRGTEIVEQEWVVRATGD